VSRWTLTDPATSEVWQMPINPDQMTSPHPMRNLTTAYGVYKALAMPRTFEQKPQAARWEWQGVIRSEDHYDTYVHWAKKPGLVRVHDHLNRTWEVMIESFEPDESRPSARTDWRYRYTVKCLIIRRIS
jgi:hypothetical protein